MSEQADTRAAFESWISAPPYERLLQRQDDYNAWPGQYREYSTQLAWEAWQEAMRVAYEGKEKP